MDQPGSGPEAGSVDWDRPEEPVEQGVFYDSLTGLPNRRLFEDRLSRAVALAKRNGEQLAVHNLEIDDYDRIRRTLGEQLGNDLLEVIAARIGPFIRQADTFARLEKSEFGIIQRSIRSVMGVTALVQKVLDSLSLPVSVNGHEINASASIGISLYSPGLDSEQLVERAENALFKARDRGSNSFRFESEDLDREVHAKLTLNSELHTAIERGELFLEYQPQLSLDSGELIAAEALLRWQHPTHGVLAPEEFIPLAEEAGLIVPIGEWVLDRACRQRKVWSESGLREVPIAINVSAVQLRDPNFSDRVLGALETSGLSPGLLDLEFTETVLLKTSDILRTTLERLHRHGVKFSIDDFGTGYSSLRYLRLFPLHKLKIAMEFVQDVAINADAACIVDAVVSLGHKLGLTVIAEGIETEEQAAILRGNGCDGAQGFYFGRPEAPDIFRARLE